MTIPSRPSSWLARAQVRVLVPVRALVQALVRALVPVLARALVPVLARAPVPERGTNKDNNLLETLVAAGAVLPLERA